VNEPERSPTRYGATIGDDATHVANVDLDIISKVPLDSLVAALGRRVDVLHVGKWGRRYSANLEIAGSGFRSNAELLIRRFVALVKKLPPQQRRLWNGAQAREFNVGIETASSDHAFELKLNEPTLDAISSVEGRLVITVYAPERVSGKRIGGPRPK
jgi:hypothetical protein